MLASNDWEQWAGPTWAGEALAYAELLSARQDLAVSWVIRPPLGVAVKLPLDARSERLK